MKTNKRGISLIVLVITIIVMIIIAAAIILSLNSSGIIGKASAAKDASDRAMLLERAQVYLAEEILNSNGQVTGETLGNVQGKLKGEGFNSSVVDEIKIIDNKIIVPNEAAIKILKAGAKIGDTVTGYKLGSTSSYEVENLNSHALSSSLISRDENVTWKYMGQDENGNALIIADVTNNTPIVTLAGKHGFLNGPLALDKVCNNLYSSKMGKARSINITDVEYLLKYTGPKGSYKNLDNLDVYTDTAKKIEEIAKELGKEIGVTSYSTTPESEKKVKDYYSNMYSFEKNDSTLLADEACKNIIFNGKVYWINSTCVYANFNNGSTYYYMRFIHSDILDYSQMYNANGDAGTPHAYAIRPVVELSSTIKVKYDNTTNTIKLS